MEPKTPNPATVKQKTNKGLIILLVIIVFVLATGVGILLSKMKDQQKENAEIQSVLENQKQSLANDLTSLRGEFASLQTDNDSLQTLSVEQQDKITKLLAVQADNTYKIKLYQKELSTLREVLRSYIVQIDSLNQRNLLLTAQKQELTKTLTEEREQRDKISEERDKLSSTVQKAQTLSVSGITVQGLTGRSGETQRVRRIDNLRTCFTVRANQVAASGERTFYIVIIKPDRKVLVNNANATFTTQEGASIVYTDKRSIDYENKDIEVCIFTANNKQLTAGGYEVNVYGEEQLLGSFKFELK
ncbi:MAG: hypothetical protein LBS09_07255 [Bacteroidales bacterium]|jgi:type II secretory pathway pseudopilin PulG|nr:hypothetical protein [Bacteroidales bacterium]